MIKRRRKNPTEFNRKPDYLPSSIPFVEEWKFDMDIEDLLKVKKSYYKLLEYFELIESEKDLKELFKDRKTKNEILGCFEHISGGAEELEVGIPKMLQKIIKFSDYLAKTYKLEI